jgi:transcriptional regulator with XRE-family HTH domain
MTQIGERTKAIRIRKKYSQEKVARRADVSTATVQRLEAGKGLPNLDSLIRIAAALDVPIGDLLDDTTRAAS